MDGIRRDLEAQAADWQRWLRSYRRSADLAASAMELPVAQVPADEEWPEVVRTILAEVAPGTQVAVINSDPHADDRPRFSPTRDADGRWLAGANLSTIFVSGNVMSRGLTLEGLTTTFFSRRSDEPLADTQMQMQRWFGYRGSYVDLCRVVLTVDQLALFESYHENDEALRRDVLAAMATEGNDRPPLAVLQGSRFRATGKIRNLRSAPLWPGPKPFVRFMNAPADDGHNLRQVADLFGSAPVLEVPPGTGRQGVVLEPHLSLLDAADLLDGLRYTRHRPGRVGPEADRWSSAEHHAGIAPPDPAWPLYRPPAETSEGVDLGTGSPYWIAAYLRLWAAALERRIRGVETTDAIPVAWSLVDLDVKQRQQPRFSVGLRFGDGDRLTEGPLSGLGAAVHPMRRKVDRDELQAGWGARGMTADGIRGDEVFDLRARGLDLRAAEDGARPAGSDGQILFHVIDRGSGLATIALGVVLPLGGPNNIEAIRQGEVE